MRAYPNILPPDKKRALRLGLIMAYAQSLCLYLFVLAVTLSGTLFAVRLLYKNNADSLSLTAAQQDDSAAGAGEIRKINAYVRRAAGLNESHVAWSAVLTELGASLPSGVTLDNIMILPDGRMDISGLAATRDDLLAMQDRLAKLRFAKDVSSQFSNLFQKKDIRFALNMRFEAPTP